MTVDMCKLYCIEVLPEASVSDTQILHRGTPGTHSSCHRSIYGNLWPT